MQFISMCRYSYLVHRDIFNEGRVFALAQKDIIGFKLKSGARLSSIFQKE
jgi:hypothetical protein